MWTQWHTAPWCSGSNFAAAHTSDRCAAKPAKDTDLPLSLSHTHSLSLSLLPSFSSLSALPSSCMAKTAHAQHSAGGVLLTTGRLTSSWEKVRKKWERERDVKRKRERKSVLLSFSPSDQLLWHCCCEYRSAQKTSVIVSFALPWGAFAHHCHTEKCLRELSQLYC